MVARSTKHWDSLKAKGYDDMSKITAETIEEAVRDAIHKIPGIDKLPEEQYCELVLEALDAYRLGIEMRHQELQEEAEDGAV